MTGVRIKFTTEQQEKGHKFFDLRKEPMKGQGKMDINFTKCKFSEEIFKNLQKSKAKAKAGKININSMRNKHFLLRRNNQTIFL